jgi:hypothetical protein
MLIARLRVRQKMWRKRSSGGAKSPILCLLGDGDGVYVVFRASGVH